jgi:hypothetical protein
MCFLLTYLSWVEFLGQIGMDICAQESYCRVALGTTEMGEEAELGMGKS